MGPELMLATPAPSSVDPETYILQMQATGQYAGELKADGIRAAVAVNHQNVVITNRRRVDVTYRYPDLVQSLGRLGLVAVLDGEIVVWGHDGNPDFSQAQRRDAQGTVAAARQLARSMPAEFVGFDILALNGIDVRQLPYDNRRARLKELQAKVGLKITPSVANAISLWAEVVERELEGIVLKRRDSTYVGLRSRAWRKVKVKHTVSALVSGYEPGQGYLSGTFGALNLALYDDAGQRHEIGSVGTGFTMADRQLIWDRILRKDHPIIVEVYYMEVSPSRHLRQPTFKCVRSDAPATECLLSQLGD